MPLLCQVYRTQYIDTAFFAGFANEISCLQTEQLLGFLGLVEADCDNSCWFLAYCRPIDKPLSCLSCLSDLCETVKMRHS